MGDKKIYWSGLKPICVARVASRALIERELEIEDELLCGQGLSRLMVVCPESSRIHAPFATIVPSQFARTLRSNDGYTISFRNGSIAAM